MIVLVSVLIAVIAAVITALSLYLPKRKGKLPAGPKVERKISILMLGQNLSGKTVLLASMWRELNNTGNSGIRLRADTEEDRLALLALCEQIEDPESLLPPSTTLGETKEWKFTVQARDKAGRTQNAFKISYLDYPGEFVDNLAHGTATHHRFDHAFHNVDAILGVIDGQKVARLMRGRPDPGFAVTLSRLCNVLLERDVKTLHIVITKWDLMAGRYSLEKVVERLKENAPFRSLMETPRLGGVRVIPISAFGLDDYAYEDASGAMVKNPGKEWYPAYVAAPLACVIPDVLATDVEELRYARKDRERNPRVSAGQVSRVFFWVTLVFGLAVVPANSIVSAVPSALKEIILKVSLDKVLDRFAKIVQRPGNQSVPSTIDENSALLRVFVYFGNVVTNLEHEIPAAQLVHGGEMGR